MNSTEQIDKQIADTPGWRGEVLSKLRKIIHTADPEILEEWKWDTAVYMHKGMVCAVSPFKEHVKINFFKGFLLKDKHKLINWGFESNKHRSIDFRENDPVDAEKLRHLVSEAVALNT